MKKKERKKEDYNRVIELLEGWKIKGKYAHSGEQEKMLEKTIIKISRETHNFPHYTTCSTCEDGWDMQLDFLIKRVKLLKKKALSEIEAGNLRNGGS